MSINLSEEGPVTVELPRRSFASVRGRVTNMKNGFRASNPSEQAHLSVGQDYALQQAASKGILRVLGRVNVRGSRELLEELEAKSAADPLTDLGAVEGDHRARAEQFSMELEERELADAEAEEWGEASEAEKRQLKRLIIEQERYGRLADAVGATARSTVAVIAGSNPEAVRSSLDRAKQDVAAVAAPELDAEELGSSIGSIAASALSQMLEQVEAIQPDASR